MMVTFVSDWTLIVLGKDVFIIESCLCCCMQLGDRMVKVPLRVWSFISGYERGLWGLETFFLENPRKFPKKGRL